MQIGSRTLTPAEVEEYNHYIDSVLAPFNGDCCAGLASHVVSDREDK